MLAFVSLKMHCHSSNRPHTEGKEAQQTQIGSKGNRSKAKGRGVNGAVITEGGKMKW